MAISKQMGDREYQKFRQDSTGAPAVAVVNADGSSIGGLTPSTDYDYIDVQQTSGTVETYVYKNGGAGGATVSTIVVTYTSSTKADIDTVEYL